MGAFFLLHAAEHLFEQAQGSQPDRQLSLGRRLVESKHIAPWQLLYARAALVRWDCSLTDVLISKGWIGEADLLPYLAQHYFAPVISLETAPPDRQLLGLLPPEFCIKHAVIPWVMTDGQLVLATSRPQDFETIRPQLPQAYENARFVLTPEDQLRAYIARVFQPQLVRLCETRVPDWESCRSWEGQRQKRYLRFGIWAALLFWVFLEFPNQSLIALGMLILFTQILAAAMKLTAFLNSKKGKPRSVPTSSKLPKISVLVPLYKETEIAQALVRRMCALTYPKALLDVVLVLEEKDQMTKEALLSSRLPNWMHVVEVPEGSGLTTKPRAMNYALDFCKGDIIGIWDAEDAPAPDQLECVAAHFEAAAPDVACLQGILDYYNPKTNWLSRCFTLEYSMWFRTIIRGMSRIGAAVPLGGTTLFLKRSAIEAVGGWDAHNVTEDADLGIRLYRYGYRTELIATVTQEEANCRFRAWIKQRSRWLKGYMVTYLIHMREPRRLYRELGLRRFLGFNAIFLSTLSQFLLAPFVWSFWFLAFGVSLSWVSAFPHPVIAAVAVLFVGITLLDMILAISSLRGQNRRWLAGWAVTLPIYFTLATLGAYKALYELIVAPFYWDKTSHGQTPEGTEADYSAFGA